MKHISGFCRILSLCLVAVMLLLAFPASCGAVFANAKSVEPGDIDSDGVRTNMDVVLLIRYLSGWDTKINTELADIDGNGRINNRDAIMLIVKIANDLVTVPAEPVLSSNAVGYIAYGTTSGLMEGGSSDEYDGLTDTTSKYNWGKTSGVGVMSLMADGGTVVITGRGMFGTDYKFEKTVSPVRITGKYGDKDYRSGEIVNAAGTGNGSQKGTFILGDKAVVVSFDGDYILDDVDIFTRNKNGGATLSALTGSKVVFGGGANVTNMQASSNHRANKSPTLNVERGAYVYLYALGFEKYTGTGTIVLSDELIASGEATEELFTNFWGRVVDKNGKTVLIPAIDIGEAKLEYTPAPAEPVIVASTVAYNAAANTAANGAESAATNDGVTPETPRPAWYALSNSKGTMSLVKDGGTVVIIGRGMFGASYTFEKTATPVRITAKYGDTDYRSGEIVNAAGTGNGSQTGTFILGDKEVTVSFAGEYVIDDVDIFTRNKTGGAILNILADAKVVFGSGANITNMQASSNHTGNLNPTLNIEKGGYVYLYTYGFEKYTGTGTIVLDRALVDGGKVAESDFAGFEGEIIYADGTYVYDKDALDVSKLGSVELEDGAIYKIDGVGTYTAVTADNFGVYDNSYVIQSAYEKDMSQLWRAHKNTDGTYSLENMACGSYLCVASSNDTIAGTALSVRVRGSADRFKRFDLRSALSSSDSVVIVSADTGLVAEAVEADGSVALVSSVYRGVKAQIFSFEKVSDGKGQYPQLLVLSGDNVGAASCPEIIYHDGVYYNYNMTGPIAVKTSIDMIHWDRHPDMYAFERPEWLTDVSAEGAIWAPGCYKMGDRYYLYYSTSSSGSRNSAIGVAVSDDPSKNDWQDLGMVIRSYVTEIGGNVIEALSSQYNCIDPNVVCDENGNYYLVYGSYWNGIFMRRLDPETGMLHKTDTNTYNIARGNPQIEAGYIAKHGDYYYLFVAKGGLKAGTYYWAVGRSETVTGPYYDKDGVDMMADGGTRLTEWKDGVAGVGHAQYFEDEDGQGYMVSESWEYRTAGEEATCPAQLHISTVVWTDDGWPVTVLDPDVLGRLE